MHFITLYTLHYIHITLHALYMLHYETILIPYVSLTTYITHHMHHQIQHLQQRLVELEGTVRSGGADSASWREVLLWKTNQESIQHMVGQKQQLEQQLRQVCGFCVFFFVCGLCVICV